MKKSLVLIALLSQVVAANAETETYAIDTTHSSANFTIRHVVSKLAGSFSDIKGKVVIDRADLSKSSVDAKINVLSVNTGLAKRDEHITQKPEYLDATKFGEMTFVSTQVEAKGKDEGILTGKLSLHGVTKEISFPFKVLGFGNDPWGGQRTGFEAHTTLKASDYGFGWAAQGNGPVGTDIDVTLLIEGVKEKSK